MNIYQISYEGLNYKRTKIFVKDSDKAKTIAEKTIDSFLKDVHDSKDYRLAEDNGFQEYIDDGEEFLTIIEARYPVLVAKIKLFEDNVFRYIIDYFYIQKEDGVDEEYECQFSIDIDIIYVIE